MTWRPGESGGGYPPRQCAALTIEDCPAVLAQHDAPPGDVELVVAYRGARRQRFFRCPSGGCARLCKALYDPDDRGFRCRLCARVDYACRHEGADPLARVAALRRRLGAEPGLAAPIPQRPAGMSRKVYDRLVAKVALAEMRAHRSVQTMRRGFERYAQWIERDVSADAGRRG